MEAATGKGLNHTGREFIMATNRLESKQRGFFDLGLGLVLSVIFGGTAAVVDSKEAEQNQLAKPATEITQPEVVVVKSDQQ